MTRVIDFLFVVKGSLAPTDELTGGSGVIKFLASRLGASGYNVSVLGLGSRKLIHEATREYFRKRGLLGLKSLMSNQVQFSLRDTSAAFGQLASEIARVPQAGDPVGRKSTPDTYTVLKSEHELLGVRVVRAIATLWPTVFFVARTSAERKYWLSQHDEDLPNSSGIFSPLASVAFSQAGLKRIVTNSHMSNRFLAEKPIRIKIGIEQNYTLRSSIESRNSRRILFPLRRPISKGAVCMIRAAGLIKSQIADAVLESFGDYSGILPNYITHHGVIKKQQLEDLYNSVSIFVLPSLVEGFGMPLVEAMACGAAAVATRCYGSDDIIVDNVNGLLVPPGDSKAISSAVVFLMLHDQHRQRLAQRGLLDARSYTPEAMFRSFHEGLLRFEEELSPAAARLG
jgi:glycosyltransferase involved in cell wall biosynthesis